MSATTERTMKLTMHLRQALSRQGRPLDTYDCDFIVGTLMQWLATNNCALVGSGVKRRKTP